MRGRELTESVLPEMFVFYANSTEIAAKLIHFVSKSGKWQYVGLRGSKSPFAVYVRGPEGSYQDMAAGLKTVFPSGIAYNHSNPGQPGAYDPNMGKRFDKGAPAKPNLPKFYKDWLKAAGN
jgi:hypothetical protein